MKPNRGSAFLLSIICIFIILLFIAGFFYWNKFINIPFKHLDTATSDLNQVKTTSENIPTPTESPKFPLITTPLIFGGAKNPWTQENKNDLQSFLDNHYDQLLQIYGKPAKDKPVTVVLGNDYPCPRYPCYVPNTHEIDFGKSINNESLFNGLGRSTILHEFIHSMHGDKIFNTSILEESITEAVTEIVYPYEGYQNLLGNYSNYEYLEENELLGSGHLTIGVNDSMGILEFMKMQYLVPDIFKKSNEDYYKNPINPLSYFLKYLPPKIEGRDKKIWIDNTYLNRSSDTKFKSGLYVFLSPTDNFLTVYVLKDEQISYDNTFDITGKFYDFSGRLLAEHTQRTNTSGNLPESVNFYFQNIMSGYKGKFRVAINVVQVNNPSINATKQTEYYIAHRDGGFAGVIRGTNSGTLEIKAGSFQKTISIDQGFFEVPELTNYKGGIDLKFNTNSKTVEKNILKVVPYYTTIISI